jgi:hypothetical protein
VAHIEMHRLDTTFDISQDQFFFTKLFLVSLMANHRLPKNFLSRHEGDELMQDLSVGCE